MIPIRPSFHPLASTEPALGLGLPGADNDVLSCALGRDDLGLVAFGEADERGAEGAGRRQGRRLACAATETLASGGGNQQIERSVAVLLELDERRGPDRLTRSEVAHERH